MTIRLIISGGPGSGCTSTANGVAAKIGLPVFDSDSYVHKPSDPPFQEQYTLQERRLNLGQDLSERDGWIVGGSVATWGIEPFAVTHGVFLNVPKELRLQRLESRQQDQFGPRIRAGGDMCDEHESFMSWAAGYGDQTDIGRNLRTDLAFTKGHSEQFLELTEEESLDAIISRVIDFLQLKSSK